MSDLSLPTCRIWSVCLNEFGEPTHPVGLKAGAVTQHLIYGLREADFDVMCMEARQVNAALSAMPNKTDSRRRVMPGEAQRLEHPSD